METNKIITTKLEKAMKLYAGIDFTKQLMVMLKSVCTDYKCQFDDSESCV